VYGEHTTKTYKTFLATHMPVGGVMRLVLVREDDGWHAFFCTDVYKRLASPPVAAENPAAQAAAA
jgi:hypothetical protein